MGRQVGRLVGRQVDRHARIYISSFKPAKGRLQKQVKRNCKTNDRRKKGNNFLASNLHY